jgi:hypothetical protein
MTSFWSWIHGSKFMEVHVQSSLASIAARSTGEMFAGGALARGTQRWNGSGKEACDE